MMAVDPQYAKQLQEARDAQPSLSWLDRGIWLAGTALDPGPELDRNRENPGYETV